MAPTTESPLTEREREILLATSRGFTVEGTARFLDISPDTVRNHRSNITKKVGLNMPATVAKALREGWIR